MADIRRIVELVVQVVDRATGPLRSVRKSTEAVDQGLQKTAAATARATKENEKFTQSAQKESRAAASAAKSTEGLSRSTTILAQALRQLGGAAEGTAKSLRNTGNAAAAAGTQAARLNQFVSQASASAFVLGTAFSILGVQLVKPFTASVGAAAEFEDTMARVAAVSGATAGEFNRLTETAAEFGRTTRFTAVQAAQGLEFLAKAGLDATEAIAALPTTLRLAQAGALGLGEAADIVTNILTASGLAIEDLDRVSDVLVKTFTSTNTSLTELGFAFRFVGTIAAGVGNEFEDTAAALGILGDAGLKSTIAGTALRGTLASLFAPTAEEERLIGELSERIGGLGLQITDTAGDFVGFRNLIEQLEQSGITAGEAIELFGQRAGPAVQALLLRGSEALNELFVDLKLAEGAAEEIARVMDDTLLGATLRMTSAFDGLKIAAGEGLLAPLAALIDVFAGLINAFTATVDSLQILGPVVTSILGVIGLLVTAAGVLSIAWALLGRPLLDLIILLKPYATQLILAQRAQLAAAGGAAVLRGALVALRTAFIRLLVIPALIIGGIELLFRLVRGGIRLFTEFNEEVGQASEELLNLGDKFETATLKFGEGSDEMEAFIRTMEKAVDPIAKVAQTTDEFSAVLEELPDNVPDEVIARLRRRFAETAVNAGILTDEMRELIETFDTIQDQTIQAFGGLDNALTLARETTEKLGKNQAALFKEIDKAGRASANVWRQYRASTEAQFELATAKVRQESAEQVKIIAANGALGAEEQARAIARENIKAAQEIEKQQREAAAKRIEILDDERRERINLAQKTGRDTLAVESDIALKRARILRTRLQQSIANAGALFQVELGLTRRIADLEQSKEDSTRATEERISDIRRRFLSDESAAFDRNFEIFKLQSAARRALAEGDAKAVEESLKGLARADQLAEQNVKDARSASTATNQLVANQKLRLQLTDQQIAADKKEEAAARQARQEALKSIQELRAEVEQVNTELEGRLLAQIRNTTQGFGDLIAEFGKLRDEIAAARVATDLFESAKADLLDFAERVRDFREDISREELLEIGLTVENAENALKQLRTSALTAGVEIPANLDIPDLQLKLRTLRSNVQDAVDQSEGVDLKFEFGQIEQEIRRIEGALEDGVNVPIVPEVKTTAAFRSRFQQLQAEGKKPITPELDEREFNSIRRRIAQPIRVPIQLDPEGSTGGFFQTIGSALRGLRPARELGPSSTVGVRGQSGGLIPTLMGLGRAVQHLAGGGKLPGFGGGDRVPAMLESGEFVINKFRARQFLPLLNAINFAPLGDVQAALAGMAGMAAGGPVGALPSASDSIGSRVALDLSMNGRTLGSGPLTGSSDTVNALVEALNDVARGRAGR
jgi:TP901 family phage tail tape measure protein